MQAIKAKPATTARSGAKVATQAVPRRLTSTTPSNLLYEIQPSNLLQEYSNLLKEIINTPNNSRSLLNRIGKKSSANDMLLAIADQNKNNLEKIKEYEDNTNALTSAMLALPEQDFKKIIGHMVTTFPNDMKKNNYFQMLISHKLNAKQNLAILHKIYKHTLLETISSEIINDMIVRIESSHATALEYKKKNNTFMMKVTKNNLLNEMEIAQFNEVKNDVNLNELTKSIALGIQEGRISLPKPIDSSHK